MAGRTDQIVWEVAQAQIDARGFCVAREVRDEASARGAFTGQQEEIWDAGTMAVVRRVLDGRTDEDGRRILIATTQNLIDGSLTPIYRPAAGSSREQRVRNRAWYRQHIVATFRRMPADILNPDLATEAIEYIGALFERAEPPAAV